MFTHNLHPPQCQQQSIEHKNVQRTLRGYPQKYKETAYISLVHFILEYSATIWDPFLAKDVTALEKVQRKGPVTQRFTA